MTVRPGQNYTFSNGGNMTAWSAGFTVPASSWGIFNYFTGIYVATATVGNRQLSFRVINPVSGAIMFFNAFSSPITAGQSVRLVGAAGLNNQSFSTPLMQIAGLPVECSVPVNFLMTLVDANTVDNADTFNPCVFTVAM